MIVSPLTASPSTPYTQPSDSKTLMALNYKITSDILSLSSSISEKVGQVKPQFLVALSPEFRNEARIDTIHATLVLNGESLSREKIAALKNNNPCRGPRIRILEAANTIEVYKIMKNLNPWSQDSFRSAHRKMMSGLPEQPGRYRTMDTAIFRGKEVIRMAPVPEEVPPIMEELFEYTTNSEDHLLIKSCLFHQRVESTQPFLYGSCRMARLWQSLILMQKNPLFEFLPLEKRLSRERKTYFRVLSASHQASDATEFIQFMLHVIDESLTEFLDTVPHNFTASDRLLSFHQMGMLSFTRKDYMGIFRNISGATASRDLEKGVTAGLFDKYGTKNRTIYSCQKP